MKKLKVNFAVEHHGDIGEIYTFQAKYDAWGDLEGIDVTVQTDCPMEGEHMPLRMLQSHLGKVVYALNKRLPRDAA